MLDRFRNFVKKMELPQEDEENLVYRIIDDSFNIVEVSAAAYGLWRMHNNVTERAVVGRDGVGDVMVRTTFSIMPENRAYKPFGTSAYEMPMYNPLLEYSRRYDTWREAEMGHREILERVRLNKASAEADLGIALAFAGAAAEVREAVSAQLPDLFSVTRLGENALVGTPFVMADGSFARVSVVLNDGSFTLTESVEPGCPPVLWDPGALLDGLRLTSSDGVLACTADDAGQLGDALIRLAQCVALRSHMAHSNS